MRAVLAIGAMLVLASPAAAYIGPGAGLGAFALTIGLVLAVVLLLAGFLWYPLKRMMRRGKPKDGSARDI
jgi:membrane protein implicated in regulation of membrane protease activity